MCIKRYHIFIFTCSIDRFHVGRTVIRGYASRRGRCPRFPVFLLTALFRFGFYAGRVHRTAATGLRRLLLRQPLLLSEFCSAVLKPNLCEKKIYDNYIIPNAVSYNFMILYLCGFIQSGFYRQTMCFIG